MRSVSHDGLNLSCRVTGLAGAPQSALLIHGLNSNMAFWHPALVRRLGADRRLLMYDQRGHGHSDMPDTGYTTRDLAGDALAVLDRFEVPRADVVAHSFGSGVALQLARLHGERVRSLVVLDGRVHLLQPELKLGDWLEFERWRSHFEAAGIALDASLDLDFTLPLHFEGGDLEAACRGLEADGFLAPSIGKRAVAKYSKLITETSAAADYRSDAGLTLESLRKLPHPLLALYGSRSPYTPTLEALRRELLDCRSETVEGGHNFPYTRPHPTADAILGFWESLAPAGADRGAS